MINTMREKLFYQTVPCSYGSIVIIWSNRMNKPLISHILLSHPDMPADQKRSMLYPDSIKSTCSEISEIVKNMKAYLCGEDIFLSLDVIRLDICSRFQQEVLQTEYRIPWGYVSTYQLIARHLGKEKGARAVGNALANNPFPIIIPCHRAIRSDKTLGGYQGGIDMKRELLIMEGVKVGTDGKVATQNIYYK